MPVAEETKTTDTAASDTAAKDTAADTKATTDQAATDKGATDKTAADTTAAEKAAVDAKPGDRKAEAPHVPESYALTLPADSALAPEDLPAFEVEAKALGLSQAQAQSLVQHRSDANAALRDQLRTELEADPVLGGANLAKTQQHAIAGLEYVFPKGTKGNDLIRDFLDKSGFGNHVEIVREFARIGKARSEDGHVAARATTQTTETIPTKDVLYSKTTSKS